MLHPEQPHPTPADISALSRAEKLPPSYFGNNTADERDGGHALIQKFRDIDPTQAAGWLIDNALRPDLSERTTGRLFKIAESRLDQALTSGNTTVDRQLKAAQLHLYLPLFKQRRSGRHAPPSLISLAAQGTSMLYDVVEQAPVHDAHRQGQAYPAGHRPCVVSEGERLTYKSRLATVTGLLMQGIVAYPATIREYNSSSTQTSHHYYAIARGGDKIPFNVTFDKKPRGARDVSKKIQPFVGRLLLSRISTAALRDDDEISTQRPAEWAGPTTPLAPKMPDLIMSVARSGPKNDFENLLIQGVHRKILEQILDPQPDEPANRPYMAFDPADIFPLVPSASQKLQNIV